VTEKKDSLPRKGRLLLLFRIRTIASRPHAADEAGRKAPWPSL
jgi:hypothetical protein